MSHETTDAIESIERRTERALTDYMTVLPEGGDIYSVTTESGSEYRVDGREGRCTCPDHRHRGARCKHLRRVAFATGARPIPGDVALTGAVDPDLGAHTDATPTVAVGDGGVVPVDGDADPADGDDGRPDDCACSGLTELPCWPCFREGFEDPADD
jgi:hypothetical protein